MITTHPIASLQGTLAKPAKPTLKSNFAKDPFSPSRSNAGLRDSAARIKRLINGLKNGQLVTCGIINAADSFSKKNFQDRAKCCTFKIKLAGCGANHTAKPLWVIAAKFFRIQQYKNQV